MPGRSTTVGATRGAVDGGGSGVVIAGRVGRPGAGDTVTGTATGTEDTVGAGAVTSDGRVASVTGAPTATVVAWWRDWWCTATAARDTTISDATVAASRRSAPVIPSPPVEPHNALRRRCLARLA